MLIRDNGLMTEFSFLAKESVQVMETLHRNVLRALKPAGIELFEHSIDHVHPHVTTSENITLVGGIDFTETIVCDGAAVRANGTRHPTFLFATCNGLESYEDITNSTKDQPSCKLKQFHVSSLEQQDNPVLHQQRSHQCAAAEIKLPAFKKLRRNPKASVFTDEKEEQEDQV